MTEILIRWTPDDIDSDGEPQIELNPRDLGMLVLQNFKGNNDIRTITEILVCKEYGTKEEGLHYHLFVRDARNIEWTDANRNKFRRDMKKILGNGAMHLNKEKIRSKIDSLAYIIKDGDYWAYNIDWWEMSRAKAKSTPKKKPYKIRIRDWFDNAKDKSDKTLTKELIAIFKDFRIPIDLDKMAKMVRCAKLGTGDNEYEMRLVELITDKL